MKYCGEFHVSLVAKTVLSISAGNALNQPHVPGLTARAPYCVRPSTVLCETEHRQAIPLTESFFLL
jgi:hypothetical protein